MRARFWEHVPLAAMTDREWEALCDGCGQCCLLKLEDEDTGQVHYTSISCRLFDAQTRRCGNYPLRGSLVPGCVRLSADTIGEAAAWMPASCAYRRLHEGRGLAPWHPLISGTASTVESAGIAVGGGLTPEYEVADEDVEDYILESDPTRATGQDGE